MMVKYRVREVAKDLNIPNKEVIDTLAKFFPEPKKYMTALEENELDIVLESFTQQRNMESLDSYFAERTAAPAAQAEKPQEEAPAQKAGNRQQPNKGAKPQEKKGQKPQQAQAKQPEKPAAPASGKQQAPVQVRSEERRVGKECL